VTEKELMTWCVEIDYVYELGRKGVYIVLL